MKSHRIVRVVRGAIGVGAIAMVIVVVIRIRRISNDLFSREDCLDVIMRFEADLAERHVPFRDAEEVTSAARSARRRDLGSDRIDAWNRPLDIQAEIRGDQIHLTVRSAGRDGVFGTADDLSVTEVIPQPAPAQTQPDGK